MLPLTLETGRALGRRRRSVGISRQTVASLVNLSYRRLGDLERGAAVPTRREVEQISLIVASFESLFKRLRDRQRFATIDGAKALQVEGQAK